MPKKMYQAMKRLLLDACLDVVSLVSARVASALPVLSGVEGFLVAVAAVGTESIVGVLRGLVVVGEVCVSVSMGSVYDLVEVWKLSDREMYT